MGRKRVFILLGCLMLACAAALAGFNIYDSERAGKASAAVLVKLNEYIQADRQDASHEETYRDMDTVMIDGELYIGVIEMPSIEMSLPVMYEWSYDKLKISPCRFTGSYYTDDLVICAHNSARHFSRIRYADIGADVYFTDVHGNTIHYIAVNRETVQPSDVTGMISDDTGAWDLTLFTCYYNGITRCALRCVRQDQGS